MHARNTPLLGLLNVIAAGFRAGFASPTAAGGAPTAVGTAPTAVGTAPTPGERTPVTGWNAPTTAGRASTSAGGAPTSAGGAPTAAVSTSPHAGAAREWERDAAVRDGVRAPAVIPERRSNGPALAAATTPDLPRAAICAPHADAGASETHLSALVARADVPPAPIATITSHIVYRAAGKQSWSRFARVTTLLVSVCLLSVHATRTHAQGCDPQWLPGDGVPGLSGQVYASIVWDQDGVGPEPARLVIGGSFTIAGRASASNIAAYDLTTGHWAALGTGTNARVSALAVLPNGDLIAAGEFTVAGSASANRIARWNGVSWSPLGAGTNGKVLALAVLPSGDLAVGGEFTSAGGASANAVARWSGLSWSTFGSGMTGAGGAGTVNELVLLPSGELLARGSFTSAGGQPAFNRAQWDGTAWVDSFWLSANGSINVVAVLPSGDVVAGGSFTSAGGVAASRIARYDPSTFSWTAMGSGLNGTVTHLAVLPGGDLVAGGGFSSSGGIAVNGLARWDGASWSPMGTGPSGNLRSLCALPNGELVAAGLIGSAGTIARWNGVSWARLSTGLDFSLRVLSKLPNGDLVAGGAFTIAGSADANRIARFDGSTWFPLGSGLGSAVSNRVNAIAQMPNGNIVAGGKFLSAGTTTVNNIASWNGSAWSPLGSGFGGVAEVYALAVLPSGDLVAAGNFTTAGGISAKSVARWNGSAWAPLGTGLSGYANALAVLPNGDLIVGGNFSTAGGVTAGAIARWNGSSWSALGAGTNGIVHALAVLPNGDLVASGLTTAGGLTVNGIARWNGSTWSAMGTGVSGIIYSLAVLDDGRLVAGGFLTSAGGQSVNNIAVWNGVSWSAFGSGTDGDVNALAVSQNGGLAIGGEFFRVGGEVSAFFARCTLGASGVSISQQPMNATVCPGGSASFSVIASGAGPFSYQWYKSPSTLVSGANSPSFSLDAVTLADAGSYYCIVSGTCGSLTSASAALTVIMSPTIGAQPSAESVCAADSATFTIAASGTGPLTYQWQFAEAAAMPPIWTSLSDGDWLYAGRKRAHISGSSLASPVFSEFYSGPDFTTVHVPVLLRCIVTNACGIVPSVGVPLIVNESPTITTQPVATRGCLNAEVPMSVAASGSTPLSYQWQAADASVPGGWRTLVEGVQTIGAITADFREVTGLDVYIDCLEVQAGGIATIEHRCLVTNICGSVTSNPAAFSVCSADFDCNGTVDVVDLFGFLDAWFAQTGVCASNCSADFDGNDLVDVVDLFDFLDAWFAQNGVCG